MDKEMRNSIRKVFDIMWEMYRQECNGRPAEQAKLERFLKVKELGHRFLEEMAGDDPSSTPAENGKVLS